MAEHLRFISKVDNFKFFYSPTICLFSALYIWQCAAPMVEMKNVSSPNIPTDLGEFQRMIFSEPLPLLNLSPSGHFLPNPSLPASTPRPLNVFLRLALALTNLLLLLLPRPLIKEVSMLSNNFFSSKRVKLQSSRGWVSNLLHYKSLGAECSLNTNELTQQKEAKRFSRSIRLDSKVSL